MTDAGGKDARYGDGAERPLHLMAADADDLAVVSALVQDAVLPVTEMAWHRGQRRFALLLNRFRWERGDARPAERVRSMLLVGDVRNVSSQGLGRSDADLILSILSVSFEPGEDGTGRVMFLLAGDGSIAVDVECLDVTLRDVTRPYLAPSRAVPGHPDAE